MSHALVTGGAGFIGCHLVSELLERGFDVRVLDSLEPPSHDGTRPDRLDPRAELHHAEVGDKAALRRALDGVDTVLHLAATGGFTPEVSRYVTQNTLATATLLETLRDDAFPVRRMIVASSMAIYGEGAANCSEHGLVHPHPRSPDRLAAGAYEPQCPRCGAEVASVATDEEFAPRPERPYSISKYDQERLVLSLAPELGIEVAALRYFLTFGPGQSPKNPYTGVISIFTNRVARGLPPIVYEDGLQTRDLIYVSDLVSAHTTLLERPSLDGAVYNVGNGKPVPLRDLAGAVARAVGSDLEPDIKGRYRLGDVRHIHADASRLQSLGWKPVVPLETGIERFVEWFRAEPDTGEPFADAEQRLVESGLVREPSPRHDG